MTTPLDQTRAAFEAEIARSRWCVSFVRDPATGNYVDELTLIAWEAWQAAIASRAAMVPVYRCTLMSRAAMKKAGQVGWFVDCAGGQTLEMRDAVQSDLDRCHLAEGQSRNPADWMCEAIPHGALVARAAIVHTMPTDFYVVAPPTPQAPPTAAEAAKETT